jgi:hypothetical protein
LLLGRPHDRYGLVERDQVGDSHARFPVAARVGPGRPDTLPVTDDFAASRRPLLEDPAREQKQAWLEEQSDRDLIKTASGPQDHTNEMELQRRLKIAIQALTEETTKARIWAAWGTAVIGVLTLALVALTIVLAVKN